eukprot:6070785-Amphidinium_carterae.1
MFRTFCPGSQYVDGTEAEVADCLAQEWSQIDSWVKAEHCNYAAHCIGKSVHESEQERPSFIVIVKGMQRLRAELRQSMESAARNHPH